MPRVERIEVRGVTRTFGTTAALRGVNVSFQSGTISLLEGPNGAGKSTLLGVIGTVLRPNAGSVRYLPLMEDDAMSVRAQLGFVAHDSYCYRDLDARENVKLAARIHGVDADAAWERVIERVDVRHLAERRVGALSRGQRQRVALARALAHEPSVLLLDEPWTGLDRKSAGELENVLKAETGRGTLIVVVSHGDDMAARLGARRVRLEAGRVVEAT
jgi:heme exporter protein A